MQSFDYSGQILQALKLDISRKCKKDGEGYAFRCILPGHTDTNPSAWMVGHAWGCHKCGKQQLTTLGEFYGIQRASSGNSLSVEDYADGKGFIVSKLMSWGVRTQTGAYGRDAVVIPYYAADGVTVLRNRIRYGNGVKWEGKGLPVYLYGLNVLAKADPKRPVLCVEGESDCHAAWHAGILAVGVPGVNMWRQEWASALDGREVYIWQEPGEGIKLTQALLRSFPKARVIVAGDDAKDVADLYRRTGAEFKTALLQRMRDALSPDQPPVTVPFAPALGASLAALREEKLLPISAVPTPFSTWNEACMSAGGSIGLARGWHITVAANTGKGKSLIGLNLAAVAAMHGETVTFVSLEMTRSELQTRLLSIVSGEPTWRLNQGKFFDPGAFDRACEALERIYANAGGSVHFNQGSLSDIDQIVTGIREQREYQGSQMVIMDYLQLGTAKGLTEQTERITRVSNALRETAKQEGIVSVGISQYNRETSKDKDNPPTVQGLMGGSALENDSDQVLLMDHTTYRYDEANKKATVMLLLAKNRHGPQTKIPIVFDFRDLSVTELATLPQATPSFYDKSEADDSDGGDASFDVPALELMS